MNITKTLIFIYPDGYVRSIDNKKQHLDRWSYSNITIGSIQPLYARSEQKPDNCVLKGYCIAEVLEDDNEITVWLEDCKK